MRVGLLRATFFALWTLLAFAASPAIALPPTLTSFDVTQPVGTSLSPTATLDYAANLGETFGLVDPGEELFGLTLDPSTGELSGTPTSAGTNSELTIGVFDGAESLVAQGTLKLEITPASPTLTLVFLDADGNEVTEAAVGSDVTFKATLTGGYSPTGSITFSDSLFGASAPVDMVDGVATLVKNTLPLGSYVITAYYDGDGNNGFGIDSKMLVISLNGPPPPPPPPEPDTQDSENLDLVQNRFVPLIALQSGGTIGDAIGNAANFGLGSGSATQFDGTGGFMAYAPEPAAPAALRNILIEETPDTFGLSVWIDARGKGLLPGADAARDGWQANITAGVGVRLTDDAVVGGLAGYEQFSYTDTDPAGTLTGSGMSIGGYAGYRIGGNVTADFGLVYTDLDYTVNSGTATGAFGAGRLLLSGGLSGSMALGGVRITPSARVFGLREQADDYTDSLDYVHDARDMVTGEASLGVDFAGDLVISDTWQLTPHVGAYVDARSDGTIVVDDLVESVGGRIKLGAVLSSTDGAAVSLDGEIGGLGTDTLTWSATGSLKSAF